MAEDDDQPPSFSAAVERLDPSLVVVTAASEDGAERDGCLVGFHTQASIHPPRYVVWLSVTNRTFRVAGRCSHLAVHSLGADDHALAEHFGGQTADDPGVDKLEDLEWTPGPAGVPLVETLPLRFVGRVLTHLEVPDGDHVGFVLEPVDLPAEASGVADAAAVSPPLRLAGARDIEAGHSA